MRTRARSHRADFLNRLVVLVAFVTVSAALAIVGLMIYAGISRYLTALAALLLALLVSYCLATIRARVSFQFMTISVLLDGLEIGDYSLRGRRHRGDDSIDGVVVQINRLADELTRQRASAKESRLLLEKVIRQIGVAILAFDDRDEVVLANPAAVALYDFSSEEILKSNVAALGAEAMLAADNESVVELEFPNRSGRFHIRLDEFREQARVHRLVFLTDVRVLLRSEERRAWQDLIRVISHEINNSLAPISSISKTLQESAIDAEVAASGRSGLANGLKLIEERSAALKSFIQRFGQLSKLPEPEKEPVSIRQLVESVTPLFNEREILRQSDAEIILQADPVQMKQVLINIFKNADEAMPDSAGVITIEWSMRNQRLLIKITDEGSGIGNPDNLFVPLYTTKEHGSGLGLVLCRQVVEAHDGNLTISNRADARGCEVMIELPV
jgi:nitrogen fixation/metabolism regulation signal transduction histidine kinase